MTDPVTKIKDQMTASALSIHISKFMSDNKLGTGDGMVALCGAVGKIGAFVIVQSELSKQTSAESINVVIDTIANLVKSNIKDELATIVTDIMEKSK